MGKGREQFPQGDDSDDPQWTWIGPDGLPEEDDDGKNGKKNGNGGD